MKRSKAEIVQEYGPFPGADRVHGVSYDGQHVWFASGDKLNAFDPANGKMMRSIDVAAHAGTAFDGKHLFQIAEDRIQKIDPQSGRVLATIPPIRAGRCRNSCSLRCLRECRPIWHWQTISSKFSSERTDSAS